MHTASATGCCDCGGAAENHQKLCKAGGGTVIGRWADVILQDYSLFNVFADADMESKLRRCMVRAQKAKISPHRLSFVHKCL